MLTARDCLDEVQIQRLQQHL
eukprot:COSAG05_NODE_13721_length_420_cov_0.638629_1_plen_20_part_10